MFYLDVRKAFDSTWHDGMWATLLDKGVGGRLWNTVRNMYAKMRSSVLVNGVQTDSFPIMRGTAQGCTLSPLLFNIFVDGLLGAVEQAGFGVQISTVQVAGLMFADDFAGIACSASSLQQLIAIVREYLHRWGLRANVPKSAVVVYALQAGAQGHQWHWGADTVPVKDDYKYLGVQMHSNCRWTAHVQAVLTRGTATVAKYSRYLRARRLSRHVRLVLYKHYVRPTLEYAAEVWWPTRTQAKQLESLQLQAARAILGCFGSTPSCAVLAELGLQSLAVRRRHARYRWYSQLRGMLQGRIPAAVYARSCAIASPKLWSAQVQADWVAHCSGSAQQFLQNLGADPAAAASIDTFYAATHTNAFRRRVHKVVEMAAKQTQQHTMQGKSTLQHLPLIGLRDSSIQPYLKQDAFKGVGTHLKMRCRTGTLQVNALLRARRLAPADLQGACPLCGDEESVDHVMLHCPAYEERREHMLEALRVLQVPERSPNRHALLQLLGGTDRERVANLLSDRFWTNSTFHAANEAVCAFLAGMWSDRQQYLEAAAT